MKIPAAITKWARERGWQFLALAVVLIFVTANHFDILNRYAVDAPLNDDFDAVLTTVSTLVEFEDFGIRFGELTSQHNEHRIVVPRLVFYTQYLLAGQINFRVLVFVGNVALVLAFLMLLLSARGAQPVLFLALPSFAFQVQHWESLTWAMAAVSHYFALAFAFASIYLLGIRRRDAFAAASLCAVVAVYSQGNGMFAFPAGAAVLAIGARWKALLAWCCVGMACILPYFIGYTHPEHHPRTLEALREPSRALHHLASQLGMIFDTPHYARSVGLIFLFAALVVGLWSWPARRRLASLYGIFVFLMLTSGSTALARGALGIEHAYASKYRVYTLLLYAVVVAAAVSVPSRVTWKGALAAAVSMIVTLSMCEEAIQVNRVHLENRREGLRNNFIVYPNLRHGLQVLHRAERLDIYHPREAGTR